MTKRIISVSSVAFADYPLKKVLENFNVLDITHMEPAFIPGYTSQLSEDYFTQAQALKYKQTLDEYNIKCFALSSHMDLGLSNVVDIFKKRMDFAHILGAKVINTNAATLNNIHQFRSNIEALHQHAQELKLTIGLENPGDSENSVINTAKNGIHLLKELDMPYLKLNYDAGNTVSHKHNKHDPIQDAIKALPYCFHMHIKDVIRQNNQWHFTAIGQGMLDYSLLLKEMKHYPDLPISIELPLHFYRNSDGKPWPKQAPSEDAIKDLLKSALDYVSNHLQ